MSPFHYAFDQCYFCPHVNDGKGIYTDKLRYAFPYAFYHFPYMTLSIHFSSRVCAVSHSPSVTMCHLLFPTRAIQDIKSRSPTSPTHCMHRQAPQCNLLRQPLHSKHKPRSLAQRSSNRKRKRKAESQPQPKRVSTEKQRIEPLALYE